MARLGSWLRRRIGGAAPAPVEPPIAAGDEGLIASAEVAGPSADSVRDFTYASSDGLTLHAAVYGDPTSRNLPVVCLPGLSRTGRDFHALALRLAADPVAPRRVAAFDYRGRGRSSYDPDPTHYNPVTEMGDVLDGMAALGINRAAVVGTSRGGIIAMLMGVARPGVLAGAVLNDIGPEIEPQGLARIKTYIGRTPAADDWDDAVRIQRRLHGAQFTGLSDADWVDFTRLTYRDLDGQPVGDYDPALSRTLDAIDFDKPMPTLWDEFKAMSTIPVLALRGVNSDLLSESTLDRMKAAHPRLETKIVEGEGHPPLLRGHVVETIAGFVARLDKG